MSRFRGLLRLAVGLLVGALAGLAAQTLSSSLPSWEIGWFVGTATYSGITWASVWRLDGDASRRHATSEDVGRPLADLMVLAATLASALAIGVLLVSRSGGGGTVDPAQVGVSILAVVGSWVAVHTMFATRYARTYYGGSEGGIEFHTDPPESPRYSDFAYLAFTIGMTFQVSDDEITTNEMRRHVLGHALTSFLFVAVLLAVMINLVASLAS